MSDELIAALPGAVLGLLGAAFSAFAAYYARNVRRETQLGLIGPRLQAYRSLWKHTELTSPSRYMEDPAKKATDETNRVTQTLSQKDLETIANKLRLWL